MALRHGSAIFVDGHKIDPTDAVAEVLKFLAVDVAQSRGGRPGENLTKAVLTIPVNFGGPQRRALRIAANKAGIGIVQFVHEPVAALYAYLRSQTNLTRELARLDGRTILVFDWGGGTLDLTLCRIQGGTIQQIDSLGDNDVGGDRFDERILNLLREKHARQHGLPDVLSLEQPGMAAKLLHQSELVKIALSKAGAEEELVLIKDYLRTEDVSRDLLVDVTRTELEKECRAVVGQGLGRIEDILTRAGISHRDVELCLATGGMVNMPSIRDGLAERFLGRVPVIENGDRIISEGAAWIAFDGLRLSLAKPIELLSADSTGRGTYHTLVPAGAALPIENEVLSVPNSRLYCVDPREGVACIEFAKPLMPGWAMVSAPRRTIATLNVAVDRNASPLLERLICDLQIDHDYVAKATLRSSGRGDAQEVEFHDLDFALSLPDAKTPPRSSWNERNGEDVPQRGGPELVVAGVVTVSQRTNTVYVRGAEDHLDPLWRLVPGDIVSQWRPYHFDVRSGASSARQKEEREFYVPCSLCRRMISQILAEGPVEACRTHSCGIERQSPLAPNQGGVADFG